MAQKSGSGRKGSGAAAAEQAVPKHGTVYLGMVGACIVAIVFAYLHLRAGAPPARAGTIAGANIVIFFVSYFIARLVSPRQGSSSVAALVASIAQAIPVFALAFFGLGFEIPEMADFGAMYILGVWAGSSVVRDV